MRHDFLIIEHHRFNSDFKLIYQYYLCFNRYKMLSENLQTGKKESLLANNKPILVFFLKLFILVIIWECSYHFILKPIRIPDKFLTDFVTAGTVKFLNLFPIEQGLYHWITYPNLEGAYIMLNDKKVFLIADVCNALDLMVIYVGFIVLLPYKISRKIAFSVVGVIVLALANIVRCVLLYRIYKTHPDMFELHHHYTFTVLMYLLISVGWILFTKKRKKHEVG